MKLREVTKQDKEKIIEMFDEYMQSELMPGIDRFEGIRDFEKLKKLSFNDWIDDLEKNKYEENLPESYSPHILYLAINDDNKIIGAIGLRWKQVPILMTFGGLIGYSIRPSQRGKGYASEMLKLALDNSDLANYIIKEPYIFDLIELTENYKERKLEGKMLERLKNVLLELGIANRRRY